MRTTPPASRTGVGATRTPCVALLSLYEGYDEEMIIHLQTGLSATLRAGTDYNQQMAMRHGLPWETLPIPQATMITTGEDMLARCSAAFGGLSLGMLPPRRHLQQPATVGRADG